MVKAAEVTVTIRAAERRRSIRESAAYPAVIADRHGRFIARGRTANISEQGAFVLADAQSLKLQQVVLVELSLPSLKRPDARRVVTYACRIARRQQIGQLVGVGVEFLQKIG